MTTEDKTFTLEDLKKLEKEIRGELKDFQRATVNRVCKIFEGGQTRVLVADEVGLGKTHIAKGVIAKLATLHKKKVFKVLYICSNGAIAKQNLEKLKIHDNVTVDGVSDARLSMQHLKIWEQKKDPKNRNNYIQLTPITPSTSFNISSGSGEAKERALMYCILSRMSVFSKYKTKLKNFLATNNVKNKKKFRKSIGDMNKRINLCDENSKRNDKYTTTMFKEIRKRMSMPTNTLKKDIINLLRQNPEARDKNEVREVIGKLRKMFAEISIDRLDADLVIMDEFQRFRELIPATNSETGSSDTDLLFKAFLENSDTKVLLLSATPYKLYQTHEEAKKSGSDDHYREFLKVMEFLFGNDPNKKAHFENVWKNFSDALRLSPENKTYKIEENDFENRESTEKIYVKLSGESLREKAISDEEAFIRIKKNAEREMSKCVCRTERLLVDGSDKLIDDRQAKENLEITASDIRSFIEAVNVSGETMIRDDYVKSCPYLLSFMQDYEWKEKVRSSMGKKFTAKSTSTEFLFLDKNKIQHFNELSSNNARLECLKKVAFDDKNENESGKAKGGAGAENLLWVPPSIPYYTPQGVFAEKSNFSKVLVFSAWAMVPRMIACMLSYEAEQRTIKKLHEAGQQCYQKNCVPSNAIRPNSVQPGRHPNR